MSISISCDSVHLVLVAFNLGDKVSDIFTGNRFVIAKHLSQVGLELFFSEDGGVAGVVADL
jgi:hypothetical protein